MAITQTQILQVVVSMFNAAPGATNLANLEAYAAANPDATTADLAAALGALSEFTALASDSASLAANFGLAAGTTGGDAAIAYFDANASTMSAAEMLLAANDFLLTSDAATLTSFGLTDAATTLNNKVTVAEYYSVTLGVDAATVADLQAVVASVDATDGSVATANTTSDAAKVAADEAAELASIDGTTFTLTSGTDSFVGTENNDLFTSAAGTLVAADTILDSSTTDADIMNVEVNSNNVAARIQNVETINVDGTYVTTGVDLANTSGTTNLNLTTGILGGTATVTNASSLNALNINAGTNVSTVAVTATASGTRDTVYVDSGAATATTITGAGGLDTFDVTTTGNLTLATLTAIDTVTANLSDATTTITGAGAGNTVINQTGVAGTVTVATAALSGNVASTSSTTITGDQNVTISATTALVTDTLITNTGTGTATVSITDDAATIDLADVQVDTVSLAAATAGAVTVNGNSSVDLAIDMAGATTLQVAATTAGTAIGAGEGTLLLNVNKTQTAAVISGTAVGTTILSAGVDALAAANAVITMADLQLGANNNTLVIQGDEALTLSLLTMDATTADVVSATEMTGALTVTDTVGVGTATLTLGSAADSITSTKAGTFTIHGNGGNDTVSIAAAAATSTVNGGNGDDTITGNALGAVLNGDAGADTITGGNAVDTINGGTGNDTINGRNGADTITTGTGSDTVTIIATEDGDVISDFTVGEDKIVLTGAAGTATITAADATNTSGVYSEFGGNHDFTLTGVTATDLTSAVQFGSQASTGVAAVTFTLATSGNLTAGDFNDHITAGGTAATINAGAGDDLIIGHATGTGTLTGGAGNDTFNIAGTGATTISDFGASDVLIVGAANTAITATVTSDFTATAASSQASTGAISDATLTLADGIAADMTLATITGALGYTISTVGTATVGSTIVGSRSVDALNGSNFADTITGGEGIDTITAGTGADTIILTESVSAADVVIHAVTANDLTAMNTIVDFRGGVDELQVGNAYVTAGTYTNIEATDFDTAYATLALAVDAAFTNAALDAADDVVTFTYDSKVYLACNIGTDTTFDAGTDLLIEVTGYDGTIVIGDIVA